MWRRNWMEDKVCSIEVHTEGDDVHTSIKGRGKNLLELVAVTFPQVFDDYSKDMQERFFLMVGKAIMEETTGKVDYDFEPKIKEITDSHPTKKALEILTGGLN